MFIIALFLSKTRVFHIFLLFVPYLPKKTSTYCISIKYNQKYLSLNPNYSSTGVRIQFSKQNNKTL